METTNNVEKQYIPGGAFLVARQSLESDLWRFRPSSWWKMWCYLLGHVQHEDYKELKRGQGYFNFKELVRNGDFGQDEKGHLVTYSMVDHFLRYAKSANMLAKRKATWGTLITVHQYDLYQNLSNYRIDEQSEYLGEVEAKSKRSRGDNINNNVNNGDNGDNDVKGKGEGNFLFEEIPTKKTSLFGEHVETGIPDPMLQKELDAIFSEDPEDESIIPF